MANGWYRWECDDCNVEITTHDLAQMLSISDNHECPPWSIWAHFDPEENADG